jgi:hypothetical protein
MKIVLDVTRLVAEGKLTPEQAEQLKALASRDTGNLAINALLTFGAIAIVAGVLALVPSFTTGGVLGTALMALGLLLQRRHAAQWGLLGTASVIVGTLLLGGGMVGWFHLRLEGFLAAAALLFALAVIARSGLLMALAPAALAAALGSSTGYEHAAYMLAVYEPTITLVVFAVLAAAAYQAAQRLAPPYEGLALIFARVSLVLVNFALWIGSLWGDYPGETWLFDRNSGGGTIWQARQDWHATAFHIPELAFTLAWAAVIVAVGVWASRANRRWVVNTAATFGAIHFYTQWFERLGAEPVAIIMAGVTVVAIAVVLWRYNAARAQPA